MSSTSGSYVLRFTRFTVLVKRGTAGISHRCSLQLDTLPLSPSRPATPCPEITEWKSNVKSNPSVPYRPLYHTVAHSRLRALCIREGQSAWHLVHAWKVWTCHGRFACCKRTTTRWSVCVHRHRETKKRERERERERERTKQRAGCHMVFHGRKDRGERVKRTRERERGETREGRSPS